MTWANRSTNASTSSGSRHNRRVRGGGTWGEQAGRLQRHQQMRYSRQRGGGTWSDRLRRLDRDRRRSERGGRKLQRRTARRKYGRTVAVGAVVLSAMLLMIPGTRGTGLMILVLAGLVLYVIARRKRA